MAAFAAAESNRARRRIAIRRRVFLFLGNAFAGGGGARDLPYSAGADPQLEFARRLLAKQVNDKAEPQKTEATASGVD